MLRCGVLNWNNITYDKDFSIFINAILEGGIVSGFWLTTSTVAIGKAILKAVRTNWEIVTVSIENTQNITIDTTWTKKVYLTINQSKLDDWAGNNIDWTEIITIATWANYPSINYIPLASITSWVITDERSFISFKWNVLKKWAWAWKISYYDWSGNEVELAMWSNWKVLLSNWTWNAPSWGDVTIPDTVIFPLWDWSDWAVTISTNTTLTRNMYYSSLTINNGIVLDPNGYIIFCSWTITNNWIIRRNWNAWSIGWNASTWADTFWAWATALNSWLLWWCVGWANWWNGQIFGSWAWLVWTNGDNANFTYVKWWVSWWNAVAGNPWAGWAGWNWNQMQIYDNKNIFLSNILNYLANLLPIKISWWAGWGGGNSASTSSWVGYRWAGGWGGGWSWWVIAIFCNSFLWSTWIVEAKWWNWWNWWYTPTYNYYGWWWGGGNWWLIILWVKDKNFTNKWTITVTGGTGWTLQSWTASWANGNNWIYKEIS